MRTRAALLVACAGAAVALAACRSGNASDIAANRAGNSAPDVVSSRLVCRMIGDSPNAAAATITGVDGAQSLRVGDTDYWFFGDTVRKGPGGRQDVIQASVATSSDFDASDCVNLDFKTANGAAQPLFPPGGETTAWPDGVLALDDGSIIFYMVRAVRTSPFAWHVGSVGLGRVPAGSLEGTRTIDTIWDENSGFGSRVTGARSPVRIGDDVVVFLNTEAGGNYAARAPLSRLADPAAYTYWDGKRWSPSPSKAATMWTSENTGLPADNGISVSRDPATGKWLAVYNHNLASIEVRTADEPWGPWSEPKTWLDCRPLVGDQYPYCYSTELHRELSTDENVLYLTFSGQSPYDVSLIELHLARP